MGISKTQIVVVGHGNYASGVLRSLKMIVGTTENFYAIDFDEQCTSEVLREKIRLKREELKGQSILFVTDIVGGSPFQISAQLSVEDESVNVVSGVNLSSILEIVFFLEDSPTAIASRMKQVTQESVVVLKNQ